jgi:hypothetical protein
MVEFDALNKTDATKGPIKFTLLNFLLTILATSLNFSSGFHCKI